MPELPDIVVYQQALETRLVGARLVGARIASPFLLRTVTPTLESLVGLRVIGVETLGKRIVLAFESDNFAVVHLMVAGRFGFVASAEPTLVKIPARIGLAAFAFAGGASGESGTSGALILRESSKKKRASLHLVQGRAALEQMDPGGIDPLQMSLEACTHALRCERHTLKRALTDPTLFSGIGNAYSDEILHRAKLSPMARSDTLAEPAVMRLHKAIQGVLHEWIDRLRAQTMGEFPEHVTAFRPEMAVHGRYGKACPTCGAPVQRIVYAENEANYCAMCQTDGKLLSDRSLSRLLKASWPKTMDELEARKAQNKALG